MSEMCHAHYEEQDPERSFFIVEAFRRSVWPTRRLLATYLMWSTHVQMHGTGTERKSQGQVYSGGGYLSRNLYSGQFYYSNDHNNCAHISCTGLSRPEMVHVQMLE